ncbi:MAG: M14 family metallocarboxypeptidase [Candidatus Neomarinimicrobiota bacterium]
MMKKVYPYVFLLVIITAYGHAADPLTPLEKNNYSALSSYHEMMGYLEQLDTKSKILTMSIIGKSVQGRDIPALYFTLDKTFGNKRDKKPLVLIYCQQHGNEPSGKEAALIVARQLTERDRDILKYLDLILVPQVNPDGAELEQRKNANDMDLNRNHVILSEPESSALHTLFLKWMPEVTLDVHEYNAISKNWISNGFIKDAEEMIGGVTNLNIAPQIIAFTRNVFLLEFGRRVQADGFSFSRYIVGAPFEKQRIRHSTTAINDGRQSMGIYNSLSFLIEGKRYGRVINLIERRTKGQVSALTAFLETVVQNREAISEIVHLSREQLMNAAPDKSDSVYIQMDYFPDPGQKTFRIPVFDLSTWERVERELDNYEPRVRVKQSIIRPYAYLFSREQERLIQLLLKHKIEMHILAEDNNIELEVYTIMHLTPSLDEDKPSEYVDAASRSKAISMKKGDVVVFLNQPAANLIPLMLEPQSTWGVVTERVGRKYRFAEFLQEGKQYPIYRLMKAINIKTEMLPDNE